MISAASAAFDAEQKYNEIESEYGLTAIGSRVHPSTRLVFLRGKKIDESTRMPTLNQFSYPPSHICTGYGRANIPHYPVLYTGESPAVIAEELELSPGSWLNLAIFFTPAPKRFEYLLLLHDELDSSNIWAPIRDELRKHITESSNRPESADVIWSRIQRASQLFRGQDYGITSAIAHHWLYTRGIDAVLYPSIRNDKWCNFAIHPRFAGDLQLYSVLDCRWTGKDIELHNTGIPDALGKLDWRATNRDDWQQFNSVYANLSGVA